MDRSKEVGGGGGGGQGEGEKARKNQNQSEARGGVAPKGKSCIGYLYHSSSLKSNGINPRCIGIPRTLQQVPSNLVGVSKAEASKKGGILTDMYYGCAGYSIYVTNDHSTDKLLTKPACSGLELIVEGVANADSASAPAHVHSKEDGREFPQPRTHKPGHSAGDDFLSRYTRNASLVASGVARNMQKVGNYVKESIDDILFPYRRRPK
ncbi:hypothetical protein JCGZ_06493 [Jatropha curcas]|uniref:DUF8204 domain-containing protein n=1 Tax=Jatropha curcas TaxID=180498 RepID=A0A067LPC2_JATCU|nr:uncharacterized protein LOC105628583 [Jatropha curcas]KDP46705.1 hypothetical protein JCGZ_06493 [Jatropha curcas]